MLQHLQCPLPLKLIVRPALRSTFACWAQEASLARLNASVSARRTFEIPRACLTVWRARAGGALKELDAARLRAEVFTTCACPTHASYRHSKLFGYRRKQDLGVAGLTATLALFDTALNTDDCCAQEAERDNAALRERLRSILAAGDLGLGAGASGSWGAGQGGGHAAEGDADVDASLAKAQMAEVLAEAARAREGQV